MTSDAREIADEIKRLVREQGQQPELRENTRKLAREVATYARSIAPVGTDNDPHPGRFRDSIKVESAENADGLPRWSVTSDDPDAKYIEYGTVNTPEHATFAKTEAHFKTTSVDT